MSRLRQSYNLKQQLVIKSEHSESSLQYPYDKENVVDIDYDVILSPDSDKLDDVKIDYSLIDVSIEDDQIKLHVSDKLNEVLNKPENKDKTIKLDVTFELHLLSIKSPDNEEELVGVLEKKSHDKLVLSALYSIAFIVLAFLSNEQLVGSLNAVSVISMIVVFILMLHYFVNTMTLNGTIRDLKRMQRGTN